MRVSFRCLTCSKTWQERTHSFRPGQKSEAGTAQKEWFPCKILDLVSQVPTFQNFHPHGSTWNLPWDFFPANYHLNGFRTGNCMKLGVHKHHPMALRNVFSHSAHRSSLLDFTVCVCVCVCARMCTFLSTYVAYPQLTFCLPLSQHTSTSSCRNSNSVGVSLPELLC